MIFALGHERSAAITREALETRLVSRMPGWEKIRMEIPFTIKPLLHALFMACLILAVPLSAWAQDKEADDFLSGMKCYKKGDMEGAIAGFTASLQENPKQAVVLNIRGLAKRHRGDLDGAIADYSSAIELDPKHANSYELRGIAKRFLGDLEGAIADYSSAIELDPKHANSYELRGIAKRFQGDLEGAIADSSRAIELDPKRGNAYAIRGNAKRAKGDLDGAIEDFSRAIELDPKHAASYRERGGAFYLRQDWRKAFSDFDTASRQEKGDGYGALMACVVQMRRGKGEAGRAELMTALGRCRDVKPADWISKIGDFLLGKLDEAGLLEAAAVPDAKKTRGQTCEAWYFAGMSHLTAGRKEEAANCFRKSIATEQKTFDEYEYATVELKWLERR